MPAILPSPWNSAHGAAEMGQTHYHDGKADSSLPLNCPNSKQKKLPAINLNIMQILTEKLLLQFRVLFTLQDE